MIHIIKEMFTLSPALNAASLWDFLLCFVFGALFVFEIILVCGIIGTILYQFGEFLSKRKSKNNVKT